VSILARYLVRETVAHTAAGLLVVLALFVSTRLASLLGDAATGVLPGGVVLELLGLRTVMALPSLLPAMFYLGMLLGLNRLARDHELAALAAAGVSPWRVRRVMLAIACAAALLTAFLSFTSRPWAAARYNAVRDAAIAAAGLDDLQPGIFYERDEGGQQVLFASGRARDAPHYLENVFVRRAGATGYTIFSAARATEARDQAGAYRFLTLIDGVQYEVNRRDEVVDITHFDRFTLRAPIPAPDLELARSALSARALLASDDRDAEAELQWRLAVPVSVLVLALAALVFVDADPRRGRYSTVLPALLFYLIFRSSLGTAKNWVADGTIPVLPGLWAVQATGAAIAAAALLLRARPATARPWSPPWTGWTRWRRGSTPV
jgi:lipopolysaccharide export system permease protein